MKKKSNIDLQSGVWGAAPYYRIGVQYGYSSQRQYCDICVIAVSSQQKYRQCNNIFTTTVS